MGTREATATIQMGLTGNVKIKGSAIDDDFASGNIGINVAAIQLANGVLDDQINRALSDQEISLADAAQLDVDLYDFAAFDAGYGAGKDNVGQALQINNVAGFLVILNAGSTGSLKVGGKGGTDTWNSPFDGDDDAKLVTKATASNPGIIFIFRPDSDGYEVADVNNHILRFEASGGAVTFSLHLLMRDTS